MATALWTGDLKKRRNHPRLARGRLRVGRGRSAAPPVEIGREQEAAEHEINRESVHGLADHAMVQLQWVGQTAQAGDLPMATLRIQPNRKRGADDGPPNKQSELQIRSLAQQTDDGDAQFNHGHDQHRIEERDAEQGIGQCQHLIMADQNGEPGDGGRQQNGAGGMNEMSGPLHALIHQRPNASWPDSIAAGRRCQTDFPLTRRNGQVHQLAKFGCVFLILAQLVGIGPVLASAN